MMIPKEMYGLAPTPRTDAFLREHSDGFGMAQFCRQLELELNKASAAMADEKSHNEHMSKGIAKAAVHLTGAGIRAFGWLHEGIDKLAAERDDYKADYFRVHSEKMDHYEGNVVLRAKLDKLEPYAELAFARGVRAGANLVAEEAHSAYSLGLFDLQQRLETLADSVRTFSRDATWCKSAAADEADDDCGHEIREVNDYPEGQMPNAGSTVPSEIAVAPGSRPEGGGVAQGVTAGRDPHFHQVCKGPWKFTISTPERRCLELLMRGEITASKAAEWMRAYLNEGRIDPLPDDEDRGRPVPPHRSGGGIYTGQPHPDFPAIGAQSPLGGLDDVIAEYDRITADADRFDAEWDFVMRASDWRVLRAAFGQRPSDGPEPGRDCDFPRCVCPDGQECVRERERRKETP